MKNNFRIITDSCCDLPATYIEKNDIGILSIHFTINGDTYSDNPEHSALGLKEFYDRLRKKEISQTALANSEQFIELAEESLKKGEDVLAIIFSSALSGTYNACRLGALELEEKYPDRKIVVMDSLSASLGQGLLIYLATEERNGGKTIEEVEDFVEIHKQKMLHYFTIDDLGTLARRGRLTASKAFIAGILNLKPVLHVDSEGRLVPIAKVMGRKQSLMALANHFVKEETGDGTFFISHGDCEEDALFLKERILKLKSNAKCVIFDFIGPVIGSHSGPSTVALFFIGDNR